MKFGKAFSDSISLHKRKYHGTSKVYASMQSKRARLWRYFFLFLCLVIGFVSLEARLFHLSVIEGAQNRRLSEINRTNERSLSAPRGILFDTHGTPLVNNVPVAKFIEGTCDRDGTCKTLSMDELHANSDLLDSPNVRVQISRSYPYKDTLAHILGYVGEINEKEIKAADRTCISTSTCAFQAGDLIGRGGVEEAFDERLRGLAGRELTEVDATGKSVRTIGKIEPRKGENITLALDLGLTQVAHEAMASYSGAVVITNPTTGEVLSMVSTPSFDPNLFTQGDDAVTTLLNDPDLPVFNRAIAGTYPPGSTFKLITAAAALEEGKAKQDTLVEDVGVITIGAFRFPNWYYNQYGRTEGQVNMEKALARSNDIYFYKIGEFLGMESMASWGKKFYAGKSTGIDIPGEQLGVMPNDAWKRKAIGEQWYLGDTYHASIGQGYILSTPLQVSTWTNVIANDGVWCTPTVMKVESGKWKVENCNHIGLKKETVEIIKSGMRQACDTGGTGWPLFKFKVQSAKLKIDNVDLYAAQDATASAGQDPWVHVPVACKTGTAEYGDSEGKTHAWFTAFAPLHNPQISVTVLVEGGGEGSSVAGPVAKKILEYWFSK